MTHSLTELLKEFEILFGPRLKVSPSRMVEAQELLTRAYDIGVEEGQDKTIYAMDEQAKNHWFHEGKGAERKRILEGLPEEKLAPVGHYYEMGQNDYRDTVLRLLEGEKSSEVRDGQ